MIRPEFIVAGCVLAVIGILLCVVGYQKTQSTTADKFVGFLEELSGKPAPSDLKSNKVPGYLSYAAGVACLLTGLAMIVKSRAAH